jgi:peptide/nickel transport system substrate-binding protein
MDNEKQRKTFLSYSRTNKDFAIRLAKELKLEGFDIWLDQLDIPAGARWDREVEKALKESEIFMIILTQASVDSENVLDEIGYAIDTRKRFLPVLLENCDVPLRLRRFQYVDFTNKNFDDGVESAKELLRGLIAQTTIPRGEIPAPPQDQTAQAEAERLAKQKVEDKRLAKAKAETERKAKEEADRLTTQKAKADQIAKQKAEDELVAKAKAEKDRLAKQKADGELAAKAEKERKAKEEADRLAAAQQAERESQAKAMPVELKAEPVSAAPAQKKPLSKGLMIGISAVVVLVVAVIAISALLNDKNNHPSVDSTVTEAPVVVNPATEAPVVANPATEAPVPLVCAPNGVEPISFPNNGKSVTGAWDSEPDNTVPYYAENFYSFSLAQMTLVGLAEWDDQGNYVPELAAEVPSVANGGISSDGLTITWILKPCLFWSDGEPITSADVKFTWESIMDSANTPISRYGYEQIDSIDTPDDQTVVIKFKELYPSWQTLFAQSPNTSGSILPKHILDGKHGLEKDPFIHQPTVSSGPFVITDWVAGDHITLLPNPNFYKGRAKLDRVLIKFVPDAQTALSALQGGDVDWAPDFSTSDMATLTALEPNIHLKISPDSYVLRYFFNLGTTTGVNNQGQSDKDGFCPFQDGRVRKAVLLGINRQAIVDTLLGGKTNVPASFWPSSAWNNDSLQPESYDPDQANQLLEEAGYTDSDGDGIREGNCNGGFTKLSINFVTTTAQLRKDIAQMVRADLARVGIDFQPNHIASSTIFAAYNESGTLARGDFDMASYASGFYADPSPGGQFMCKNVPNSSNPGGENYLHICDPQLDELIVKIDETADLAQRKQALDTVQEYIYNNSLAIPIYTYFGVYGYADRFLLTPFNEISGISWNAEDWDVK